MFPRGTASKVEAVDPRVVLGAREYAMTSVRDSGVASTRPSAARVSVASQVSAVSAMSRGDLSRMRMFCVFAVIAASTSLFASVRFGGDPALRQVFWIGLSVILACQITSFILVSRVERYRPALVAALWLMSNVAFLPTLAYIGPFSLVLMVNVLALMFISLGELQWTALATLAIHVAGQFLIALPILLDWAPDRSLAAVPGMTHEQLWLAEGYSLGFMVAGFLLGRWARATSVRAVSALQQAQRVIGDNAQALAEVVDDARDANRFNEGRWTHHTMGSFTLGVVLGRGAMGEVYEAVRSDGELAAVKLLDARAPDRARRVERFHREMAIAARLSSPHLVQVYELSSPDAAMPYVAMERLHGTALASRLRLEVRIPSDEVAMMLYQVACGLDVARRSGLVHRDLKPQNLFFHAGTTWKILDLGVSTLIGSGSTAAGDGGVGTAQYMAPEQVQGGEVGHRADVYALGAVAYRCLTGRALFHARDFAELAYQIAHTPPPRPSTISQVAPVIEDVLAIALAKDPRRRFPSARGFAQAFICARRGTPVPIEIPPDAWR